MRHPHVKRRKKKANNNRRTAEDKALIEKTSYSLQEVYGGVIPTAQTLNKATNIEARKIQRLTTEGEIWQKKTAFQMQRLTKLKKLNSKLTQKQLAEAMGLSERQIRNLENRL